MSPVALITGGQQGIGLGIATALTEAGFTCVLAAERPEDDPTVAEALARLGPTARYLRHDLRDTQKAAALIDAVHAAAGPITAFVSNAGVPSLTRGDMLDLGEDSFDLVMSVNLRGAFFLAQEVARRMLAQDAGPPRSLTFITSVSAEMATTMRADYCISKAGASMMARLFAARLAPHGIGVFELRPGIIETAMTGQVKTLYDQRIADGLVPAGRWGHPADIGSVVVPIATGQMAFATGAVIPVDGGLSVPRL